MPATKDHTLYYSIYMNIQNTQIQRQRVDQLLPRARWDGRVVGVIAKGHNFFWGDENVQIDCDDGYTTL